MLQEHGGDVNLAVAASWKALSDEERAVYKQRAADLRAKGMGTSEDERGGSEGHGNVRRGGCGVPDGKVCPVGEGLEGVHSLGVPLIPVPPLYMEPSIDTTTAGILGIEPPEPMQGALGAPLAGPGAYRAATKEADVATAWAGNDGGSASGGPGADVAPASGQAVASKGLPLPLPLDVGTYRDYDRA
jgi:hypothetical protein